MVKLMAHQQRLVELTAAEPQRYARHLLEWDPGTGKTMSVLGRISEAKLAGFEGKTLVIAPLSVLNTAWASDARNFPGLKVVVCWARTAEKRRRLLRTPGADVLVINPGSFRQHYRPWKHVDELTPLGITRLVFDESDSIQDARTYHKGRPSGSEISAATYEFSRQVREVYLLSGTPTAGRESDYFAQMRCVDPGLFGISFHRFAGDWMIADKRQIGWTPRPELAPFVGAISLRTARSHCMRHQETIQAMLGLGGYFRDAGNDARHFPGGRMDGQVRRLLSLFHTDREPKAFYSPDEVRRLMGWFAGRLSNLDLREQFFEKMEAIAGYRLIEAKREEFYARLRRRVWVLKRDDCIDLPGETDNIREVALDGKESAAYETIRQELKTAVEGGQDAVVIEGGGGEDESQVLISVDANAKFMKLRQIPGGTLKDGAKSHRLGRSKLDCLMELLHELRGHQVVIFAEFTAEIGMIIEAVRETGAKAEKIDGSVDAMKRTDYQDRFNAGEIQYLVCHPAAAAHGLNLQKRCRYDCFYSLGFDPRKHKQARARIYRNGQTEAVTHFYLIATGTTDEKALSVLREKTTLAAAIKETVAGNGRQTTLEDEVEEAFA